jgi:hypothetical protein
MTFVTSDIYPNWKGHLLVGSLKFQYLELVKLDGAKVIGRQKIATDIGRYVMWRKGRTVSFIWGRRKGNSKNYTQLKHLEKSPSDSRTIIATD